MNFGNYFVTFAVYYNLNKMGTRKKKLSKKRIEEKIRDLYHKNPNLKANYKQISKQLNINTHADRKKVIEILEELKHKDFLEEIKRGQYSLKNKVGYLEGTIELTHSGYAYFYSDDFDEPIFIAPKHLNFALDGDRVMIYLFPLRKDKQPEGEVVEILERANKKIVGTLEITKGFGFVIPSKKHLPFDIFIPASEIPKDIKGPQKVIAEIVEWHEYLKNPIGRIVKVLGPVGDNDAEIHAILEEFELPYEFPKAVEKEAAKLDGRVHPAEIKRRLDYRKILTFTIDPFDAKDFDDAISFRDLENGNYEIGVHIADVTHYVRPGTILDDEAFMRGTSVYLVDRVVPMFPEKLSNFVCSLRPNEEKLTFSVIFEFDKKSLELKKHKFAKTVIKSDRRFNYEEVQEIIETGKGDFAEEILKVHSVTKKLREERFANGALSFENDEVKFILDDEGNPTGVYFKESKDSNHLIEELMLLANKKVAERFTAYARHHRKAGFVYRVHDKPNPEKLKTFANFVKSMGFKILMKSRKTITSSLNNLLETVKGTPLEDIISTLTVRTMAKAVYSTKNIGHYGLAFKDYTHFTSPIRRYPDMMVHRLLELLINDKPVKNDKEELEKQLIYLSKREQVAEDAERTSIKYMQVEFLQDKIGQVFDGIISGVHEIGLFVELIDTKAEGLVHIRSIPNDFYVYDDKNYRLVGVRYKKVYQLGDKVKVRLVKTNLLKKQIDLVLVEEETEGHDAKSKNSKKQRGKKSSGRSHKKR